MMFSYEKNTTLKNLQWCCCHSRWKNVDDTICLVICAQYRRVMDGQNAIPVSHLA